MKSVYKRVFVIPLPGRDDRVSTFIDRPERLKRPEVGARVLEGGILKKNESCTSYSKRNLS